MDSLNLHCYVQFIKTILMFSKFKVAILNYLIKFHSNKNIIDKCYKFSCNNLLEFGIRIWKFQNNLIHKQYTVQRRHM